jgi:hypothetical protein
MTWIGWLVGVVAGVCVPQGFSSGAWVRGSGTVSGCGSWWAQAGAGGRGRRGCMCCTARHARTYSCGVPSGQVQPQHPWHHCHLICSAHKPAPWHYKRPTLAQHAGLPAHQHTTQHAQRRHCESTGLHLGWAVCKAVSPLLVPPWPTPGQYCQMAEIYGFRLPAAFSESAPRRPGEWMAAHLLWHRQHGQGRQGQRSAPQRSAGMLPGKQTGARNTPVMQCPPT